MTTAISGPIDARTPFLTGLLMFLFAGALPVAYLWAIGFSALGAIGGLACIPLLRRASPSMPQIWLAILLTAWALVSLLWSRDAVDPHLVRRYADVEKLTGLKLLFQVALYGALMVTARRVAPHGATWSLNVLTVVTILLGLIVWLDASLGAAIYLRITTALGQHIGPDIARRNITQGEYAIVLFVWCIGVRLYEKRLQALTLIPLCSVIGASLIVHEADAPLAALALGLIAFVGVLRYPALGVRALAVATTFYWLTTPLVVMLAVHQGVWLRLHQHVRASWSQRLDIWSFSAARVGEHPLVGWGLDASRTFGSAILLHTHNAALQVWLELGLVGALLMAGLWLGLWRAVEDYARRDRTLAAAAAATATAYLTIGGLSFGVWQEWWLALGVLAIVAVVCLQRSRVWWNAPSGAEQDLVPL